ncbi:MAG: DUF393 domain-containing protein [Nitrospira sp.]|nr:DUF393 domain-containing protein [Nitrospira sp.]
MAVYPLTVFYDGACPICAREMALMKRLDRTRRLTLLDFSPAGFDAAPTGLAAADLSAVLHAQWADGTVITGIDVFRAMWEAVGLGLLSRLNRLPLVAPRRRPMLGLRQTGFGSPAATTPVREMPAS